MRVKKSELAEMVRQLSGINDQINRNNEFLTEVNLSECQELAVKLGEFIEETYKGENTVEIIHLLEDYCELIYQISVSDNHDVAKIHKLTQKVRKTLLDTEQKISYDLPKDRKQIVFLPYKASMWDSLESIWMVARDDPEVDTYVIPIPFYDRNPDGSVRRWHYEGDQYPDYVPIIDWQKYSIPYEKPDVIFIHNPYDGNNYVTSVHPTFYSSELEKNTNCLVYVPYFILNPENGLNIPRDFVILSSVINSRYVVVQNELEKQGYLKRFRENGIDIDQSKFLPYGSPKIDHIKSLNIVNTKVPTAWIETITHLKPRMIVFFNTSVGALLRSDCTMYIQNMMDFFNLCNEMRVLVIWRTHPLMKATIESMRPQFFEVYQKVEDAFIRNKLGIFDDTHNMDAAILMSDVYAGDWSSVVYLYKHTGKPIMHIGEQFADSKEYDQILDTGISYHLTQRKEALNKLIDLKQSQSSKGKGEGKERCITCGKKIYMEIIKNAH